MEARRGRVFEKCESRREEVRIFLRAGLREKYIAVS